jgi:hypothetical protein
MKSARLGGTRFTIIAEQVGFHEISFAKRINH